MGYQKIPNLKKEFQILEVNQSICVKNNKTQKIERVKKFRARDLVDKGGWTYVTNSEWRAQKKTTKPESAPKSDEL